MNERTYGPRMRLAFAFCLLLDITGVCADGRRVCMVEVEMMGKRGEMILCGDAALPQSSQKDAQVV